MTHTGLERQTIEAYGENPCVSKVHHHKHIIRIIPNY